MNGRYAITEAIAGRSARTSWCGRSRVNIIILTGAERPLRQIDQSLEIRLAIRRRMVDTDACPIVVGHVHEIGNAIRLTEPVADGGVLAEQRRVSASSQVVRQSVQQCSGGTALFVSGVRIDLA